MCAAKMAGKAARMAANTPPEQPSALHKNDDTPARPGCAMMAHK